MTRSPLMKQILARRPWLEALLDPQIYGFSSRRSDVAPPSLSIARRLISAYRLAEQDRPAAFAPDDVWRQFVEQYYGDMIALIRADDERGLINYLLALPRQGAGHGFFQGQPAYQALESSPERQEERALWLLDHLAGLAEALGIVDVRCPEQGEWGTPAFSSIPDLCSQIESTLGLPVCLPPLFEDFFALNGPSGPCHLRSMQPALALHQLTRFFLDTHARGPGSVRLAEIGAGIGCTGYLAAQLGLTRYSVFDLPEVNVAQGFFLLSTLGEDQVRLYGEPAGASSEVLPAWTFALAMEQGCDAVLNIDSFPEIDREHTRAYLQAMRAGAEYFFSINQEAPRADPVGGRRLSVRQMTRKQPGFQQLQRHPNWIRSGYVDELYRITDSARTA